MTVNGYFGTRAPRGPIRLSLDFVDWLVEKKCGFPSSEEGWGQKMHGCTSR